MKKVFAVTAFVALLCFSALVAAAPTEQQVQAALARGDYSSAQQMLAEVVQEHPGSARAHYLYAQVLDRSGRPADALKQLDLARLADPALRFTQPNRFAEVEQRIRNHARPDAARTGTRNTPAYPLTAPTAAMTSTPAHRSGASIANWLMIIVVLAAVAGILVWGVRRARRGDENRSQDALRAQLKQATELLNAIRALKFDIRVSAAPGHELLAREADALEARLLSSVENLSARLSGQAGQYADQNDPIDSLRRQVESLKARAEGRPDPYPLAAGDNSPASEAERFSANRQPASPTVIVQQTGGGGNGGFGGLLTGVLLGGMMSGGRERIIERDVIVDDQRTRPADAGIDYGQGDNDWGDGGIDMGGGDNWSDN